MIVRFAINPTVLTSEQYGATEHKRLINLWLRQRIGVLYDLRDNVTNALGIAIREINDKGTKDTWQESYKIGFRSRLVREVLIGSRPLKYTPEIVQALADRVDMIIVNPGEETEYGGQVVRSDDLSTTVQFSGNPSTQVEMVHLGSFNDSNEILKCQELRGQGNITPRYPVDDVWRERFLRLFNVADDIHIVDRYICIRHSQIGHSSGLYRLVELAKKHSPSSKDKTVTIYAELPEVDNLGLQAAIDQVKERVSNLVAELNAAPKPIREIKIQFVPKIKFTEIFRDRHIRFASVGSVGGGHGSEVLEGRNYLTEIFKGISWNADISSCKALETELATYSQPPDPIVLFSLS